MTRRLAPLAPGPSRYAVYALPGALPSEEPLAHEVRSLAEGWYAAHPEVTVDARRYGFHATLKAPIRLARGRSADDFDAAVAALAAKHGPVEVPGLRIAALDGFRALLPTGRGPEVCRLADAAVRALDPFRAIVTAQELARRRPERLTAPQHDHLLRWGYPYVFEEFRFHMTLTDQLAPAGAPAVDAALRAHFAPVVGRDLPIASIAVFEEPEPGAPFRVRSVHALTGAPVAGAATAVAR